MLTKKQLKQLRNEITLNSLFLKDYSNSFYIKEKTVLSFFDSFIEYLYDSYDTSGMELFEILDKYDNIDELYNYYISFEYDPLTQDDYIAYSSDTIFSGVVIYNIDYHIDVYIYCASYYTNTLGIMQLSKITRNKLYYDNNGDRFIIKNKRKYYIDRFIKVNEAE